jgi:DNA-binding NarL/FixJ family response regulator
MFWYAGVLMDRASLERLARAALIERDLRHQERIALLEAEVAELKARGASECATAGDRRALPSARHREIAILIARGLANTEIAARLMLTPGTVGNHVTQIMRKLGARGRAEVAVWAVKQGLV